MRTMARLKHDLIEEVATPLETIAHRGHHQRNVYRDWVSAMLAALCSQEDKYCEIVQSYPNDRERGDREADLFAEAFGDLQYAMAETDCDVLGEVYEHLGLQNGENGQHFTPHSVCQLKVSLTIDKDANSVRDPACGSGRLLMEASKTAPDALYVGRDNDRLCAKMAALNMCFFNVDAVIIYGDSLKVERRRAWKTANTPLGGTIREVDPEAVADIDEAAFGDNSESEEEQDEKEEGEVTQAKLA